MDQETAYRRRWGALVVLVICLLVVVADNTVLNVALRVLSDPQEGLGASQSQLAWSINSYTLVFAGLLFTFGVVGDRLGRRRVLAAGLVVFGAASLASAYAQSPDQLIGARALMGLGAAAVMPQTLSIITDVFPAHERGRAIGIWAGSVGLALGIGPPLGGLLLQNFWWGSIFLINVPFVLLGLALMGLLIPESRNDRPGGLDPLGVLLSIAGLVLLVYGIITAGARSSFTDPDVYGSLLAGLTVLVLFVFHEARTPHPSLDVTLFRNARVSVSIATIMLLFFAMSGVVFFLSFYWQSVREFTPLQAGLLVLPVAVAQMVFAPISPGLVRRFGPRLVAAVGILGTILALAFFSTLGTGTPVWLIEVVFFVQGAGMALVMTPATESIMASTPPAQAGAASAVQNTVRQVATAVGVAVLGAVISIHYRSGIGETLSGVATADEGARLSEQQIRAAGESIEATMALARRLGPDGESLVAPAKDAFLSGLHLAALISTGIALVCLVIVLIWLPREAARHGEAVRRGPRESGDADADTGGGTDGGGPGPAGAPGPAAGSGRGERAP